MVISEVFDLLHNVGGGKTIKTCCVRLAVSGAARWHSPHAAYLGLFPSVTGLGPGKCLSGNQSGGP